MCSSFFRSHTAEVKSIPWKTFTNWLRNIIGWYIRQHRRQTAEAEVYSLVKEMLKKDSVYWKSLYFDSNNTGGVYKFKNRRKSELHRPVSRSIILRLRPNDKGKHRRVPATTTNRVFNLKKEMETYCQSDVDLLRRGCTEFRKLFI